MRAVDVTVAELPVARLRRAGCVFAEQEAAVLTAVAAGADRPGARLEELLQRREAGEPLEHLVGWVDFGPLRLHVGPGAFVPRQRSRALAQHAVAAARRTPVPVVVEACAGVAPIAAAVARALPHAVLHVTDVDAVPLEHAARNLPSTAGVHCGPLLGGLPQDLRGRVDVLAAVPPYVPDTALHLLPREAREHEPLRALLGGRDGLVHVRVLVGEALGWLRPGGRLLLELNPAQIAAAAQDARAAGWRVRDLPSRDGRTSVLAMAHPGRAAAAPPGPS